jgi:hypothetical protein
LRQRHIQAILFGLLGLSVASLPVTLNLLTGDQLDWSIVPWFSALAITTCIYVGVVFIAGTGRSWNYGDAAEGDWNGLHKKDPASGAT